jgi:Protein of unknown function (DUF3313)
VIARLRIRCLAKVCQHCLRATRAASYLGAMSRRTSAFLLVLVLALVACSPRTTRAVKTSGFLGDYSRLQPGGSGRALLVYRAPDANLARYDKVLLDPVTVCRPPDASDAVSRADLQRLADLLYGMLLSRLRTYLMVQQPGPQTLRIRAALTEATPSSTSMDIMSQIGPVTGAASRGKEMATGTPAWVGAASAEIQVLDAETGKELLAAADRRVGEKTLTGSSDPWSDVTDTFALWADAVINRLQAETVRRASFPGGHSRRADDGGGRSGA